MIELLPRAPYSADYVAGHTAIGFAFDAQRGVHAIGSDRLKDFHARPNTMARVPVGCDVYSRSDLGGEYLRIVDKSTECDENDTQFSDAIDPQAIEAAHSRRRQFLCSDRRELCECERLALIIEERAADVAGRAVGRASSWMTPRRFDQLDDMIKSRLAGTVTVQELASSLNLSAGFLNRAFRASTGITPYTWIAERRLDRARTLLRTSNLDLAGIAAECGFSSHAHMTARFRQRFGVVPSRFRNRLKVKYPTPKPPDP